MLGKKLLDKGLDESLHHIFELLLHLQECSVCAKATDCTNLFTTIKTQTPFITCVRRGEVMQSKFKHS